MKTIVGLILVAGLVTCGVQAAETAVNIKGVHLCCKGCAGGVQKAINNVSGVTAAVDQDTGIVTLTGPDKATLQKAAEAMVAGGFFGTSDSPEIKLRSDGGTKGKKVKGLKLEGTHLCCGECVSALDKAVKSVPGVTGHTAARNAKSYEVTGDFNDREVVEAIQKAGLSARVAK